MLGIKAAFDTMDRGKMVRAIRERRVREGLVNRCEKMLKETKREVRVGLREKGRGILDEEEVRQGCLLSPSLFTLLVPNLEKEMRRGDWGGVSLGIGKVYTYTLVNADNMAIMAANEEEIKRLMARLKNTSKTKMMRCRKKERRKTK